MINKLKKSLEKNKSVLPEQILNKADSRLL